MHPAGFPTPRLLTESLEDRNVSIGRTPIPNTAPSVPATFIYVYGGRHRLLMLTDDPLSVEFCLTATLMFLEYGSQYLNESQLFLVSSKPEDCTLPAPIQQAALRVFAWNCQLREQDTLLHPLA